MALGSVINGTIEGDEGVGECKDECDDDPCDGRSRCKRPTILPVEAVGDLLSPPIVPWDGTEKAFVLGKLEGGLLNGYQHCCHISLAFVIDGFRPVINQSCV